MTDMLHGRQDQDEGQQRGRGPWESPLHAVPPHPHFGLGGLGLVGLLAGLVAIGIAIGALFVLSTRETVDPDLVASLVQQTSSRPALTAADGGAAPAPAVATGGVVEIRATEFAYDPATLDLDPGRYTVRFYNDGSILHDIAFGGLAGQGDDQLAFVNGEPLLDNKVEAQPGEIVEFELVVPESDGLGFFCTIAGHREAGMEGRVVTGANGSGHGGGAAPAATTQQGVWEEKAAQPITLPEVSRHPMEMPGTRDYTLYDNGEYQGVADRTGPVTQEVHFYIEEGTAEVLPGTTMNYWTFDGAVPGPMIRAREGDTVHFFLHNAEASSLPHNVDFHAVTGPGGGAVVLDTAPGAVSDLAVKVLAPGIYIYHCAFPDIPTHLAHGMYGLIVVEPEGGLPAVDHEYYVLQSDWYTVAGGSLSTGQLEDVGHLDFGGAFGNLEQPSFVTFNGRPGAAVGERAIGTFGGDQIETGDTVRLFVGNAGPNLVSSFHAIGEIFDTVYVEGSFDLVNRNVQSTLVPAGGAVGVEFRVEMPGSYVLVDHSIFRIHKGAIAQLDVVGVPVDPAIFAPGEFSDEIRGGGGEG